MRAIHWLDGPTTNGPIRSPFGVSSPVMTRLISSVNRSFAGSFV
jgi:hypothetical protein